MIDERLIDEAGRRLGEAAPGATVILFGSHARGDAEADSDLDFLVVMRQVPDHHREMVRLERELRSIGVPVDIVVVSNQYVEDWSGVPGTMIYDAVRDGRVLQRAA